MPGLWRIPTQFRLPPNQACVVTLVQWFCSFLTPNFNGLWLHLRVVDNSELYSSPEAFGYMSPLCRFSDLGPFRLRIFFRPSGESNPRPWWWIKSARDQRVKCNERRTRPCHRAYSIRGSTPFHFVRGSPVTETCVKWGSNRGQGPIRFLLLYRGSSPFTHCATSVG